MTYLTRALIRCELGDGAGARADADRVDAESPEAAAFVRTFADLVFPRWVFSPLSSFPPVGPGDELPAEPAQPLTEIRRVIQVYATRLRLLRASLPEAVCAPPLFASATGMALTRFARIEDVLVTGGLRAMSQGVPGFVWESQAIDDLPRPYAQMAADECFELRAVFLWMVCPENLSPFQSDLRQR